MIVHWTLIHYWEYKNSMAAAMLFLYVFLVDQSYSSEIAPAGQVPAQAPQLMQRSLSITNCPSPSEIAPTGHPPAQAPHDKQASEITNAIT